MSFNHEADRHREVTALLTRIAEGIELMADAEAQALADLQSAVTDIGTAIAAEIVALQAAINAQGVNNSPAIEASVAQLRSLIGTLNTSVTPPPAASTPAPVADSTPAPAAPTPVAPTT